jgi:RecA/RadA recombinase
MGNKWMQQLQKMEGAFDKNYSPFAKENVLRSPSPSLNWIFGKGAGIPYGYSAIFYGPPKSGKSLASYLMTSQLHKDDPEAIAIRFDTEMRADAQLDPMWGIDPERFMAYNVNDPTQIYDRIANEFNDMLEQGMPIKMIIIDSLQGMKGVKRMGKDSVADHLMGDDALTHTIGLKNILPIIRKYKIALICTSHIRANLDAGMYGPKEKMAGGWAQKHFFEYFVEVKKNNSSSDKIENDEVKDFRDKKEITGHKIYVKMVDSSVGIQGRSGQFTLDYRKGLINVGEEIATLAKSLNLIEMPNNRTYIVGDKKYTSKADFTKALEEDQELSNYLVEQIYARDMK